MVAVGAHSWGGSRVPRWLVVVIAALIAADLIGAAVAVAALPRIHPAVTRAVTRAVATVPDHAANARPPAGVDTHAERAAAVRSLLARRAVAVLRHDERAFLATVDPAAPAFAVRQRAMFAHLSGVPFAGLDYDLDAASDSPLPPALTRTRGPTAWLATVTLHYRLAGFDRQPTSLQQYLTFVRRPGGWYVAADDDGASRGLRTARELWDFGPVAVVHGSRSLVLGHPAALATMRLVAAEVDRDVPRVTAVSGPGWAQRVVVLVPGSQRELETVVGSTDDLTSIAAVATAEIGGPAGAPSPVGDRIAVNPGSFDGLGALGRRIVLTHEVTHVATRAVTGVDSPLWLVEGIADYVAFKGSGVATGVAGRELATAIAAGRLPTALPTDAAFDSTSTALPAAYEQAWLACRFIASRTDEATLIRFYRTLGTSTAPRDGALRSAFAGVLHTDQATFTRSWRSYLQAELP